MNKEYYLDSCIWLNLFKKEVPYWKFAKDFIERVENNNEIIFVSTIVLKEIYFTTKERFKVIQIYFKESKHIKIVKTIPEDYELARKWEKEDKKLSFYDYLHVAITKRLNLLLITRDGKLMKFAKGKVRVSKPENLIS